MVALVGVLRHRDHRSVPEIHAALRGRGVEIAERRRLRVVKMRGIPFRSGFHDFAIRTGGLEIYPRLVAAEREEAGGSGEPF